MSRNALIVGINTYQYLPELQAPARDAEAIARQLQTYGEFRVQRQPEVIQAGQPQVGFKTQVSLRELESALVNLFKPKGSNIPHTALFYFSGHGIQKEAGIQEGYLALSDTNPETGFYGLSLFWLRRLLQESPVRQRIIWLDCCHSGELLNFLEADPGARPGTDRLFMAASKEYESAYESLEGPYSVFTQALLRGLDPQHAETGIVTNHNLTAWVSSHLQGELQQPLFESSGSEIILTRSHSAAYGETATSTPASSRSHADICPYRGLEFFDEAHAEYFFGREDLTDQLLDKLRTGQFVAVVGASGSGKSSLVRAGLLRELRRGQRFSGSDRWRIKLITPSEQPLKSLAGAFVDLEAPELERAEQLRRAEEFLQTGSTGLSQLVRASLMTETTGLHPQQRPHLLLVIDQFEEVFTLCQGTHAEQERHRFFNSLTSALQTAGDHFSVLIVLRADFFGKCSLYETLAQHIEQNLVMVTPLSYEQIKSTITRPAQKVGLLCEPNLVYTMLLDVIGSPGELPLLQYTLLELWKRRQIEPEGQAKLTLDTYTELGGVRGTLQKRATEIFYNLTSAEQVLAKRIFLALTQLGEGTEDTRRRVLKSELVGPSFPAELVEKILEKLVASKLIVTSRVSEGFQTIESGADSGTDQATTFQATTLPQSSRSIFHGSARTAATRAAQTALIGCQEALDVTHEALIRNWSLLRSWLDENREMLRRQRRIERAAQEWDWAGQLVTPEYLLSGNRLLDTEDFLNHYPSELSALANQHLAVSQEENHRMRRAAWRLQLALPSMLIVLLMVAFNQYRSFIYSQPTKQMLQPDSASETQAIARLMLPKLFQQRLPIQPFNYLQTGTSSVKASSSPVTCQHLRISIEGSTGTVKEVTIIPNQPYIVETSTNGTIDLRSLGTDLQATPDAATATNSAPPCTDK
jgi:energy-coupling factor transporter ATP-binding protein EcfA2